MKTSKEGAVTLICPPAPISLSAPMHTNYIMGTVTREYTASKHIHVVQFCLRCQEVKSFSSVDQFYQCQYTGVGLGMSCNRLCSDPPIDKAGVFGAFLPEFLFYNFPFELKILSVDCYHYYRHTTIS